MYIVPIKSNTNTPRPTFDAKINFDYHVADKRLVEYEKNNFISGVYIADTLLPELNNQIKAKISKYMADKALQDYSSTHLYDTKPNEAPYKFAAIVKKQFQKTGNSIIHKSTPKIFENIPLTELTKTLDILSYFIRNDYMYFKNNEVNFNIGDKVFNINYAGKGCNGIVCGISDSENKNTVAFETYIKPEEINTYSIFGELALYQEIGNSPISNIPSLMFANPLVTRVTDSEIDIEELIDLDQIPNFDGYKGGWTIIEYITEETPTKQGESIFDWLNKHNLHHLDLFVDNFVGKYLVDLGGIGI